MADLVSIAIFNKKDQILIKAQEISNWAENIGFLDCHENTRYRLPETLLELRDKVNELDIEFYNFQKDSTLDKALSEISSLLNGIYEFINKFADYHFPESVEDNDPEYGTGDDNFDEAYFDAHMNIRLIYEKLDNLKRIVDHESDLLDYIQGLKSQIDYEGMVELDTLWYAFDRVGLQIQWRWESFTVIDAYGIELLMFHKDGTVSIPVSFFWRILETEVLMDVAKHYFEYMEPIFNSKSPRIQVMELLEQKNLLLEGILHTVEEIKGAREMSFGC